MKNNTSSNKKNRITVRFAILFTVLIVSHISYSCFKENNVQPVSNSFKKSNSSLVDSSKKNNTPPVYAEIPDANFKAYLRTIVPDAFTHDNKFISNHPSVISYNKSISIRSKKFTSLSGIEYFISLTRLDCMGNQLTTLDVSKNIALTELFCGDNQLTTLEVSRNPNLKILECSYNKLTSLNLSKNTNLTELNCYRNKITTLNLIKNKVLSKIFCAYNQLDSLDVSKNKDLIELNCINNQRTTIVIINPNTLSRLYIDASIKCCHPSIKTFRDRGGNLFDSHFQAIPSFSCL
ncbi:Internalin-J precursor [compost metagenome]